METRAQAKAKEVELDESRLAELESRLNRRFSAEIERIRASSLLPSSGTIKRCRLTPLQYSWDEVNERREKGLCIFCEENETPDHHLKHKGLGLVILDVDDQSFDEEALVESVVELSSALLMPKGEDTLELEESHTKTKPDVAVESEQDMVEKASKREDTSEVEKKTESGRRAEEPPKFAVDEAQVQSIELVVRDQTQEVISNLKHSVAESLTPAIVEATYEYLSDTTEGNLQMSPHHIVLSKSYNTHQQVAHQPRRVTCKNRKRKCSKAWKFKYKSWNMQMPQVDSQQHVSGIHNSNKKKKTFKSSNLQQLSNMSQFLWELSVCNNREEEALNTKEAYSPGCLRTHGLMCKVVRAPRVLHTLKGGWTNMDTFCMRQIVQEHSAKMDLIGVTNSVSKAQIMAWASFAASGREVNLTVLKIPEMEQRVLDVTDIEYWGPHGTALAAITHATKKFSECHMVMSVLWTRLRETGKDWRYVYKALAVIDYLISNGSERAVDETQDCHSNNTEFKYKRRLEEANDNCRELMKPDHRIQIVQNKVSISLLEPDHWIEDLQTVLLTNNSFLDDLRYAPEVDVEITPQVTQVPVLDVELVDGLTPQPTATNIDLVIHHLFVLLLPKACCMRTQLHYKTWKFKYKGRMMLLFEAYLQRCSFHQRRKKQKVSKSWKFKYRTAFELCVLMRFPSNTRPAVLRITWWSYSVRYGFGADSYSIWHRWKYKIVIACTFCRSFSHCLSETF